jgi:hypothetical protein
LDDILDEVVITCMEDEVEETLDKLNNPEYTEFEDELEPLEIEKETK